MLGRTFFRVGFLVILSCHPAYCFAQSQVCTDSSDKQPDSPQGQKLAIDNVEIQGSSPLTFSQWSAAVIQIKNDAADNHYDPNNPRSFTELVEAIRRVLQNEGYFRTVVTPNPVLLRTDDETLHYLLNLSINPGEQYLLAQVHFRPANPDLPALAFPEAELRQQLDLKTGDLFDVSKIREGLDSLEKLYRSKGFIDMVPTPETDVHDAGSHHDGPDSVDNPNPHNDFTIDLTFVIDEGKPYRIAQIEVFGLSVEAVRQLEFPQMAGDIFLPDLWENYFASDQNPPSGLANSEKTSSWLVRDSARHTLQVRLHYGPCPDPSAVPIIYSQATVSDDPASSVNSPSPADTSQDP